MTCIYQKRIEFISYIQRLLENTETSSTYKFALLHALADLCIESDISKKPKLKIEVDDLVERIFSLYWQHAKPFKIDSSETNDSKEIISRESILHQSTNKEPTVIKTIRTLKGRGGDNLTVAKKLNEKKWVELFNSAKKSIREGPLWRLQLIENNIVPFLYEHKKGKSYIQLNEGVADSFRFFHDIVVKLVRQGWADKIASIKSNQASLGKSGELADFLFGSKRVSLKYASELLEKIQGGYCFYCEKKIKGDAHVDHFIPLKKYNYDLAHNFVLAHKKCNQDKSSHLALKIFKDKWVAQNLEKYKDKISSKLSSRYMCDPERSRAVADTFYEIADKSNIPLWGDQKS
ncbi:HNH endonuclease [Paraglaciecola sp. L1A13]|uniref:HNH endonuclease n=1 Tax=Paraglaciecola sp. L1A13 TaxID=2686359 RepID=UPI00131AD9F9|nr:HNH endonuclease [Paraglaciecola sp. L1A13]